MHEPSQHNILHHVMLLASAELKKILFSPRGIIALTAFALVCCLLLWYPIRHAADYLLSPDFKQLLLKLFGADKIGNILSWQVAEMAVLWLAALYLFPLFSLVVGADQFASDKARGSLRFLTLRAHRNSVFFGRLCGCLGIQAILLLITLLATLLLVAYRDTNLLLSALDEGLWVFINIMILILPFTALMALLSLWANSPRQASLYAVLLLTGSTVVNALISHYIPGLGAILQYAIPGAQIDMLINTKGLSNVAAILISLLQAGVLLQLGRTTMVKVAL